jgi:hypothetical protein
MSTSHGIEETRLNIKFIQQGFFWLNCSLRMAHQKEHSKYGLPTTIVLAALSPTELELQHFRAFNRLDASKYLMILTPLNDGSTDLIFRSIARSARLSPPQKDHSSTSFCAEM